MTSVSQIDLDTEELFHLAVRDSQDGKHDEAINKLKDCLRADPKNAKAQFMLGAEHAEIGLYERAVEEMRHAIELDASMGIAHFQLGLIYFTQNKFSEARQHWAPLLHLRDSGYLAAFSSGLLNLAEGHLAKCIRALSEGISANTSNSALNADMTRILARAESLLKESGENQNTASSATQHVFLGSYRDQAEDN